MLSLAHTLVSLPVANFLDNPIVIFVVAALLHFPADMIPHWNVYPDTYKRFPYELVALDVVAGLGAVFAIFGSATLTLPILAAIAGGNAPDIVHSLLVIAGAEKNPARFPWWINKFMTFHHRIQFETVRPASGLFAQGIIVSLALYLLTV